MRQIVHKDTDTADNWNNVGELATPHRFSGVLDGTSGVTFLGKLPMGMREFVVVGLDGSVPPVVEEHPFTGCSSQGGNVLVMDILEI